MSPVRVGASNAVGLWLQYCRPYIALTYSINHTDLPRPGQFLGLSDSLHGFLVGL